MDKLLGNDKKESEKKENGEPEKKDDKKDQKKEPKLSKAEQEKLNKEKQAIKGYKLKDGNYQIQVRIIEANDLIPKPSSFFFGNDDAVNAFAEVKVNGVTKKTKVKEKSFAPIWNKGFTFKLQELKKEELQNMTIQFTVKDKKSILDTEIIGAYSLDLSSVYFSYQHEMYMTWLTLTDPTDEVEGIMGYLRVNITMLGPEDEPPVHDLAWQKSSGGDDKEKALIPKKVKQQGHQIKIDIYRAEHLSPLDINDVFGASTVIQAYAEVKYGGQKIKTKKIESINPEWNERLLIQCMLPNNSKQITVSVYDYDLTSSDDLVGTFQIPFKEVQDTVGEPRWANIYGAPVSADNEESNLMTQFGNTLGSHYRGRVFYKISTYYQQKPKTLSKKLKFSFPKNPFPTIPQKSYVLRIAILEGIELPERDKAIIHVQMGPYLLKTTDEYDHDSHPQNPEEYDKGDPLVTTKGGYGQFYERLPDKKVEFPVDIDQCPDIIFYFADKNSEKRRHSFCRIKAKDILSRNMQEYKQQWQPRVLNMVEDRSLDLIDSDEFPGFLYVQVSLIAFNPPRLPHKICLQKPLSDKAFQFKENKIHQDLVVNNKHGLPKGMDKSSNSVNYQFKMPPKHIVFMKEPEEEQEPLQEQNGQNIQNSQQQQVGLLSQAGPQDPQLSQIQKPKVKPKKSVKFSILDPPLQDIMRYFITFNIIEKDPKDKIYIGLMRNKDSENEQKDHGFEDIFKKQVNYHMICSDGSVQDNPSYKNNLKKAFKFKEGDKIMLDIKINTYEGNSSSITFFKYERIKPHSQPVEQFKLNFDEIDIEKDQYHICLGLSSHKSKVEFLINKDNYEKDDLDNSEQVQEENISENDEDELEDDDEEDDQNLIQDNQLNDKEIDISNNKQIDDKKANMLVQPEIKHKLPKVIPFKFLRQQHKLQLQKNYRGIPNNPDDKKAYELRVFLYHGRDIPPSDESGTSDPFIQIRCAGQAGYSDVAYSTLNPGWFQTIKLDVDLNFDTKMKPGMFVVLFDSDKKPEESSSDSDEDKGKKRLSEKPEIMNGADLIGRVWVPFDCIQEKYSVPRFGIFSKSTVNRHITIVDPQTLRMDEQILSLQKKKLLGLMSKPIKQEGIVEYYFKIEGLNDNHKLSIGLTYLNFEEEDKKQQSFILDEKLKNHSFQVSATGKLYYKSILDEHHQNKLSKKNKDFHFAQSDVVHVNIDFTRIEDWEVQANEFIIMKGKKQKFKTIPITFTVFKESGEQKCQNTYYFTQHINPQDKEVDKDFQSDSDSSDEETQLYNKQLYISCCMTTASNKDEIRFMNNDKALQFYKPTPFQNQKNNNLLMQSKHGNTFQSSTEEINVMYSNPKTYTLIYDPTGQQSGNIMMGYAIVEKQYSSFIPIQNLKPLSFQMPLTLFFIGVRDIEMEHPELGSPKKLSTTFDISGDEHDPVYVDAQAIKRRGINVNKILDITIDMVTDPQFCPVMDIIAWECQNGEEPSDRRMFGYGSLKLADVFEHYLQKINKDQKALQMQEKKDDNENKQQMQITQGELNPNSVNVDQVLQNINNLNYSNNTSVAIPQEFEENIQNKHMNYLQSNKNNKKVENIVDEIPKCPIAIEKVLEFDIQDYNALQEKHDNLGNAIDFKDIFEETVTDIDDLDDNDTTQLKQKMLKTAVVFTNPQLKQNNKKYMSAGVQEEIQSQKKNNAVVIKKQRDPLEILEKQTKINKKNEVKDQQLEVFKCEVKKHTVHFQLQNQNGEYLIQAWTNKKSQQISQDDNEDQDDGENDKLLKGVKKYRVTQLIFTENKRLLFANPQIQGTVEKSQIPNLMKKLEIFCKKAKIVLKRNFASFEDNLHHQEISIEDSSLIASINLPPDNIHQLKLAVMQPVLQRGSKYQWSFKIVKLQGEISVGICHSNIITEKKYNVEFSGKGRGHGTYQLTSAGIIYNNFNKKTNGAYIGDIGEKDYSKYQNNRPLFQEQDIVKCSIDALQTQITFEIEKKNFKYTQNILYSHEAFKDKKIKFKEIYICVGLANDQDKIEFLSGDKELLAEDQMQKLVKKQIKTKEELAEQNKKQGNKFLQLKQNISKKGNSMLLNQLTMLAEEKKEVQEDYDTDPDEDLSITPEWMKGRKVLHDELEDFFPPSKKMLKIPLSTGQSRGKDSNNIFSSMFCSEPPEPEVTCYLKCKVIPRMDNLPETIAQWQAKIEEQKKLMVQKSYICRVYITRGIHIGGDGNFQDIYLQMDMGDENEELSKQLKQTTLVENTNNPDFYIHHDFECKLPGSSILNIELYNPSTFGSDDLIGFTKIDVEERYFTNKWSAINEACHISGPKRQKMPIEQRNLEMEDGGSAGRLGMWLEIIPKTEIRKQPPVTIYPPPQYEFELRVVVWETKNCVLKDELEECNDLYVRGGLARGEDEETDIHWRCRGKGSFNWRWKFPVKFPMVSENDFGNDKFKISLWDKDLIGADDLIGECEIDLNYHQMINKAVKRQQRQKMFTSLYYELEDGTLIPKENKKQQRERLKREKEEKKNKKKDNKGKNKDDIKKEEEQKQEEDRKNIPKSITNKIWYDVFNPTVKSPIDGDEEDAIPIPQGQVCVSFELVPKEIAEKEKNGSGRDAPNQYPVLPEPEGRLSFDIRHPLDFIKQLIGPNLYNKIAKWICLVIFCAFFIYFMVFFINNTLAVWVASPSVDGDAGTTIATDPDDPNTSLNYDKVGRFFGLRCPDNDDGLPECKFGKE